MVCIAHSVTQYWLDRWTVRFIDPVNTEWQNETEWNVVAGMMKDVVHFQTQRAMKSDVNLCGIPTFAHLGIFSPSVAWTTGKGSGRWKKPVCNHTDIYTSWFWATLFVTKCNNQHKVLTWSYMDFPPILIARQQILLHKFRNGWLNIYIQQKLNNSQQSTATKFQPKSSPQNRNSFLLVLCQQYYPCRLNDCHIEVTKCQPSSPIPPIASWV